MKNPFKGKKPATPEAPVKMKPTWGVEYKGRIYKSAKEADIAYQKDEIRKLFPNYNDPRFGQINAWVEGAISRWEFLVDIAHKRLEMEKDA